MSTYLELLNKALTLTNTQGVTDVISVSKEALERAMKYIARKTDIRSLISIATYTWASTDTEIALGVGGFGITDFQAPHFLTVDTTTYEYMEYKDWLVTKSTPGGWRDGLDAPVRDLRNTYAWTINYSENIELYPIPDSLLVSLYYFRTPAIYADSTTPELESTWQDMLVDAACLVIKTYIENPSAVINFNTIFKALDPFIDEYKQQKEGRYKRGFMRIKNSYNIKGR